MHVPDELRHLRRVVQIANLGIVDGADIPASIERFARRARPDRGRSRDGREATSTIAKLRAAALIPLAPESTVYFPGDRAMAYSPVAYLPAVAAVVLGSVVGASPLVLLYLARLSLLAFGAGIFLWSIRRAPALKWPLCFVALLPMASFMRSGVTADTMTTAFAFLLFVVILRLKEGSGLVSRRELALLTGAGVGLALCKLGYLPLTLTALTIPIHRFASRRSHRLALVLAIGLPLLASALWIWSVGDWTSDGPRRANPHEQLRSMFADPLRFVGALISTWLSPQRLWRLAETFVGRLLLLTVHLPAFLVVASLVALAALLTVDDRAPAPSPAERLLFAGTAVVCLLVISVGAYVQWSAVGGLTIRGMQGRYLYPLAPFLMFALAPPRAMRSHCSPRTAVILVVTLAVVTNVWGIAGIVFATWHFAFGP